MIYEFEMSASGDLIRNQEGITHWEVEEIKLLVSKDKILFPEKVKDSVESMNHVKQVNYEVEGTNYIYRIQYNYKEIIENIEHAKWRLNLESKSLSRFLEDKINLADLEVVCKPVRASV
jgi:hypothetical protein